MAEAQRMQGAAAPRRNNHQWLYATMITLTVSTF